jgi:two-component system, cell cycle sensor histidine kinase and response regulator CckA
VEDAGDLELTRSLLRVAGDLAAVGGWAISLPDRTISWSEEIHRILDAPPGLASLDAGFGLYEPGDLERLQAAIDRCAADGTPFDLQLRLRTFTGRPMTARLVGEAQLTADGSPERLVGAFQDVSELVGARERAAAVETRLFDALESMTDAFYLLDREWRFAYLNPRAEQLLQRPASEILGREVWEAFPETVASPLNDAYHLAASGGGPQVVEAMWYAPLSTWFRVHAYPSPQGVAVYFRDVTEEQGRQEELEAGAARLREQAALLDESQDAIVVLDLEGVVTYWNAGAGRTYGWDRDEATGRALAEVTGSDARAIAAAAEAAFAGGTWHGELRGRTKTGDEVIAEARWSVLRGDDGLARSVLATHTDVTERRRIEQQLLRAQRMESIGTLAGGIAHDLNNVLAPILLAVELLAADEVDPDKLELLQTVRSSSRRGADMVQQVLSFARGVSGERAELDVRELVGDVLGIVRDAFPRSVRVEADLDARLAPIVGDATQIHQVLMNLLVNARDALPEGGCVHVRAGTVVLDRTYAAVTPEASAGTYVAIDVQDEGTGMSPEVVDRVFEPFFTTKPHGEGTGLGLSTTLAIVRGHGGHVSVYSEPGEGTTFRVHLPVAAGSSYRADSDAPEDAVPLEGDGERVLLVDDEASVRDVTRQTLRSHGYEVEVAADGAEAVARFAEDPGSFELVITDVMMPIMDGPATVHALRSIRSEVPIIATSGLDAAGYTGKVVTVGADHVLAKPYTATALLALVRQVLDEHPG